MSILAVRLSLALLAGVFVLAAACGDDDDSSSEDPSAGTTRTEQPTFAAEDATYLQELEGALAEVEGQRPALDELYAAAFGAGGTAEAADSYGVAYVTYLEDREAAVNSVAPSEELSTRHATLADGSADAVEFARQLHDRLQSDAPMDIARFAALLNELDAATATQRYRDACTSLQVFATTNDIDVNLGCLQ